jgi:predicted DNA-binding transcriptional regulator YafY
MKTERLIQIIVLLLNHRRISATELANRFNVTKRTIYRDVDSLINAGIPMEVTRGRNGGITISNDYHIDNRMLSTEDLQNILTALESLSNLSISPSMAGTLEKLQKMSNSSSKITYLLNKDGNFKSLVSDLESAITSHYLVRFNYIKEDGSVSLRTVEPSRLYFRKDIWYLRAYDKATFKNFRLSRMTEVSIMKIEFRPRIDDTDIEQSLWGPGKLYDVTLEFDNAVRYKVAEMWNPNWIIPVDEQTSKISLQLSNYDTNFEKLFHLGNSFRFVDSDEYRSLYINRLSIILNKFKQ